MGDYAKATNEIAKHRITRKSILRGAQRKLVDKLERLGPQRVAGLTDWDFRRARQLVDGLRQAKMVETEMREDGLWVSLAPPDPH